MAHYECKYCDSCFGSTVIDGDRVCIGCGAEWADAKILVDDEEDGE
ncbi:hypothetical protein QH639_22425 [Lysinibacillus sp. 1 U-2021]|nr:hypothetical protein [Lysinibacillus sp. 1 U-2021]WGT38532.1 hypothetical protein QH639_22425 [Lysinibacillus sp. 1 U-2021]